VTLGASVAPAAVPPRHQAGKALTTAEPERAEAMAEAGPARSGAPTMADK